MIITPVEAPCIDTTPKNLSYHASRAIMHRITQRELRCDIHPTQPTMSGRVFHPNSPWLPYAQPMNLRRRGIMACERRMGGEKSRGKKEGYSENRPQDQHHVHDQRGRVGKGKGKTARGNRRGGLWIWLTGDGRLVRSGKTVCLRVLHGAAAESPGMRIISA
jgi:hypothetical protein